MSAGDIITTFSIWLLLIVEAYADGLNMINNLYIQTTCIVKDPVKSISSHYLDQALKQIFFFSLDISYRMSSGKIHIYRD